MKPIRFLFVVSLISLLALAGCNRAFNQAPTPFSFPTPDLTLTAIFAVLNTPAATQAAPQATSTAPVAVSTSTQMPPAVTATSPVIQPTNTFPPPPATATNTQVPLPTNPPAATSIPERPRGHVVATYLSKSPTIDADLQEWNLSTTYSINEIVFGKKNWSGPNDDSGKFQIGWDKDYLYLAIWVIDDIYSQVAPGENLYKGDSVEILFDSRLAADFNSDTLSSDDFQLGISPGTIFAGNNPNAYLWFPESMAGARNKVLIDGRWTEKSYSIEIAIPWDTFGVTADAGQRYGFAVSLSDADTEGEASQDSMVSNIPTRVLTDPTTWGDLQLKK